MKKTAIPALGLALIGLSCGSTIDRDGDGYLNDPELAGGYGFDCSDWNADIRNGEAYYLDGDGDGLGDPETPCYACLDLAKPIPPSSDTFQASAALCVEGTYVHNDWDCDDTDGSTGWGVVLYRDGDDDGLGDPSVELTRYICPEDLIEGLPLGYALNNLDCDDTAAWDPGSSGHQDAVATVYYPDGDLDGYGQSEPGASYVSCNGAPEGYVTNDLDCDDSSAVVNPDRPYDCDDGGHLEVDDDCDGRIDEDSSTVWYPDEDVDGFGSGTGRVGCPVPEGWVRVGGDCNDSDKDVYPGSGC